MSRASGTGHRSGRATAFVSCRGRLRCGSTRQARGCPRRCFQAPTPSASCNTSYRPATIIRGSCSPKASSRMNTLVGDNLLKLEYLKAQIEARDREIANPYVKDTQVMNIHNARRYIGDRLIRTAKPHRILDSAHGPLIAVKLNILTRKTLGGFETDLDSRVFGSDGQIMPGLYAAGEAAGFGGGGMHGYRSLEGTFLGGCLFSGRNAGRAAAKAVS